MNKCDFYDESKYGLKPKKKPCRNLSTLKIVVPVCDFSASFEKGLTEIQYAWVCAMHGSMVRIAKQQAVEHWKAREAEVDAILDETEFNHS